MEPQHHPRPVSYPDDPGSGVSYPDPVLPGRDGPAPVTGPAAPGPVEHAGAPDALRAAALAREHIHRVMPGTRKGGGRGVEWVRPTDLLVRHAATWSGRGVDFQAELSRRARAPLARTPGGVGARARRLPPLAAFGRGSPTAGGPTRSGVGMS